MRAPSSCNLQNLKKSKAKKLFNFIFRLKMQEILHKTHFGYVGVANLKFCSIDLKFRSQDYKVLTNALCKTEKKLKIVIQLCF
jgi:hypothetical protein